LVDVIVGAAQFFFFEQFHVDELVKVFAGSQAAYLKVFHDKLDFGVGVIEQIVDQFMTVYFWLFGMNGVFEAFHQGVDLFHQLHRVLRSHGNTLHHVKQPGFPFACAARSSLVLRGFPSLRCRETAAGLIWFP
tara:strand:- start:113 stop:511 length:399 start_codon:yes stop_codon:yes gene_type:complete